MAAVLWLILLALAAPEERAPSGNRFVDAGPARLEDVLFGTDASAFAPLSACEHDFSVAWSAQLGAPAYATPVVSRLPHEPSVRVTAATFSRHVEALRGSDGHELLGWPHEAADGSQFHAPPLLHDLDGDGVDELVLLSYDGEVRFVHQRSALPLMAPARGGGIEPLVLRVPRLRVRRGW